MARVRVRHLRVLRVRLGDALRAAGEHRVRDGRRLHRVREGVCSVRRHRSRRHRPIRRSATGVRRRHHVQSGEGLGRAVVRPGRGLRRRRSGTPGGAVREDRRCHGRRCRPHRRQARDGQATRSGLHGQRRPGGSGSGDTATRRRGRRDRTGGVPAFIRAGIRIAAAQGNAGLRRAAGRQRGAHPDL